MPGRLAAVLVAAALLALTGCSGGDEPKSSPSAATSVDPTAFDTTWEFPEVSVAANVEPVVGRKGIQGAVRVAELAVRDWMANTSVLDAESTYQVGDFDGLRQMLTPAARAAFDRSLQESLTSFSNADGTPTQATLDVQALALYRLDGDSEFPDDGGPWVVDPRMDAIAVSLSGDGTPIVKIDATIDLRLFDTQRRPIIATISRETSFYLTEGKDGWRIYSWHGQVTSATTRPA